ncbi:hypothetical protein Acsp04_54920 [Actinomadura sp. NBRC 104425]|uniref:hypothetical protein n=1 Tax=Actinomadura sp. NBRC 104425 TaxID=3032204 RepID=UPI0024A52DCA|nr:hypothetical protein [Actinomadura sp. NBRC 104425]GLZ15257.1 hypothetical protein Acsp04_54920 [Actinomadura sp. NBRC 104425]
MLLDAPKKNRFVRDAPLAGVPDAAAVTHALIDSGRRPLDAVGAPLPGARTRG